MNLANKITLSRVFLVPLFVLSFIYYDQSSVLRRHMPLAIFLAACVTDCVDGVVARLFDQRTKIGSILDPLADKLLLVTAFVCLAVRGALFNGIALPAWVTVLVISRDGILIAGSAVLFFFAPDFEIRPSWFGKLATLFQMATVISVLTQWHGAPFVWTVAAFFTIISGVYYVRAGSRYLTEVPA